LNLVYLEASLDGLSLSSSRVYSSPPHLSQTPCFFGGQTPRDTSRRSSCTCACRSSVQQLILGHVDAHHVVKRLAHLCKHGVERLCLFDGPRKTVKDEPFFSVLLFEPSCMMPMITSSGTSALCPCTPCLKAHFVPSERSTQDVACRDLGDAKLVRHSCSLCSLPEPGAPSSTIFILCPVISALHARAFLDETIVMSQDEVRLNLLDGVEPTPTTMRSAVPRSRKAR